MAATDTTVGHDLEGSLLEVCTLAGIVPRSK